MCRFHLASTPIDKNVVAFQISMNDILPVEVDQSSQDLDAPSFDHFQFRRLSWPEHELPESSWCHELCDENDSFLLLVDVKIVKVDDIAMI